MNKCVVWSLLTIIMIHSAVAEQQVIRVLNWSEFITLDDNVDPALPIAERSPVLKQFMQEFDCKIEYYEYDDTNQMLQMTTNTPGFYDVVISSHSDIKKLITAQQLHPLIPEDFSNYKYLIPKFNAQIVAGNENFYIPYLVGTTGLLYRKDLCEKPVTGWIDLFKPEQYLKGKINLLDDMLLSFPMALQSLGYGPNSQIPDQINQAGRLIYNLKNNNFLNSVSSHIPDVIADLASGKCYVTPMFSGDALSAIEKYGADKLAYILPHEGGEFYVDAFILLKSSNHKILGKKFINFMIRPEVHAQNAIYLKYQCPNKAALEFIRKMAPSQLENLAIYPKGQDLRNLRSYGNYHPDILRLWTKIFDVK